MTDLDLMLRCLFQLGSVLAVCRVFGWLGTRFLGQTQVVMEMVAGVALGPSLFGLLAPELQRMIFPTVAEGGDRHPSMSILYVLAQLGLILYMFLVGVEFDPALLRGRVRGAVGVSLAGIAAPFALGAVVVALFMGGGDLFFRPEIGFGARVLYLGAAMSITAFPMLARIIYERGIAGSTMGTLALGAGATDDAVAWSLLAVVLAVSKGSVLYAVYAIGGGALFALVTLTVGRRAFAGIGDSLRREGRLRDELFFVVLFALIVGAYITDALGIYAVFGAFLIGCAMPKGELALVLKTRIEPLTTGLLLPLFFVYSGLNTKLTTLNTPGLWLVAGVVLVCAIVGKGVACALAARTAGEPWRESWAIGTLMNSRGLMELIILNIGLAQGIITSNLFATMVLMAIVTTLMASPLFLWIMRRAQFAPAALLT